MIDSNASTNTSVSTRAMQQERITYLRSSLENCPIDVKAAGFRNLVRSNIVVSIVGLDLHLTLVSATEAVSVNAAGLF